VRPSDSVLLALIWHTIPEFKTWPDPGFSDIGRIIEAKAKTQRVSDGDPSEIRRETTVTPSETRWAGETTVTRDPGAGEPGLRETSQLGKRPRRRPGWKSVGDPAGSLPGTGRVCHAFMVMVKTRF
jgi:hypothetical protein